MADTFKDIVPSILLTKKSVITEENEKEYKSFLVNRTLSYHMDCVPFANEMNKVPNIDPLLQYHYLLNTVRRYKRPFRGWQKRSTIEAVTAIKEYYKYSEEKAKSALVVLSPDQIDVIKKRINKGGLNDKPNRINRGNSTRT